jgi:cell division protein FtsZ
MAEIAREIGALTVAVVTKPFNFEGPRRMRLAEEGIDNLRSRVDTVIVVPNDKLLSVGDRRMTLVEAFKTADDVLRQGVQGISDIITIPGMINVDFADVRAIMSNAGSALMGIGAAGGDHRAVEAAQNAVSSQLLETSINGATRVLVNITSGHDLTLAEFNEAAEQIHSLCDQRDANIIFGWVPDAKLEGEVRVTVLATGFDTQHPGREPHIYAARASEAPRSYSRPDPEPRAAAPAPPPTPPPAPPERAEADTVAEPPTRAPSPEKTEPRKPSGDDYDIPAFLRKR